MKNTVKFVAAAVLAFGLSATAQSASAREAHVSVNRPAAVSSVPAGVDDGSGYWGPESATGGPSGGLPNSN